MNILFLTLSSINSIDDRNIYADLLRDLTKKGHNVVIVTPTERRFKIRTNLLTTENVKILQVKTLNIKKTNIIEKGIGTLTIEYQYLNAIRKFLSDVHFHLVLYSTPPITFSHVIRTIKKRDNANSYLLLKDIFPQNAVDLGMMKKNGILHRFFRHKEKKLYLLSDYIGCMSQANVDYLLEHNTFLSEKNVETCPNSIELRAINPVLDKIIIREKYSIPLNSTLFIYGGSLGKPQGLDFLLKVLEANKEKKDRHFLIVGSGTEYGKIANWFDRNKPNNSTLIAALAKQDYDELVQSCDVGMIFLDPRFTIPNYPSRLLSYLENQMPVVMATDMNTDIGKIAEENSYGLWCENGDLNKFNSLLDKLCLNQKLREEMGRNGYAFLNNNYLVSKSAGIIMKHFDHKIS